MTFIEQILATSRRINDGRSKYAVLAKGTEELGELAQEVMIEVGDHYKPAGKDGIIGEAVDLMVCCVDLIYGVNPNITEAELQEILGKKLAKWAEKAELQQSGCVTERIEMNDLGFIEVPEIDPPKKPKQVILVRSDLNMPTGKLASQVSHASMKVFFDRAINPPPNPFGLRGAGETLDIAMTNDMWNWKDGEFTKIILEVKSEEQLLVLFAKAHAAGLPCSLIQDNGHTVFKGVKTFTTVAIGPANPDAINEITGNLRLLP